MGHNKKMYVGVMEEEELPVFVSTRRSLLKINGGTLDTLYDMKSDQDSGNRNPGHACKKDYKGNGGGRKKFKPWQRGSKHEYELAGSEQNT